MVSVKCPSKVDENYGSRINQKVCINPNVIKCMWGRKRTYANHKHSYAVVYGCTCPQNVQCPYW